MVLSCVLTVWPAFAELQNVEVGGEIRLRGNYISDCLTAAPQVRWPGALLVGRPIGGAGNNVLSAWDWDGGNTPDMKFVEHRTRLHVKADFTDSVCAFVELDSYDWWGQDFRSNYVTGVDRAAVSNDDVEVFQSYVEANEMWGQPLRLRLGRQELAFGSQWLVGTGDFAFFFTGLSFDAVRLTYAGEDFTVDAWASKLAELSPLEQDGDTDFYGVYGSYTGVENLTLDAYWMYVRDAAGLNDTAGMDWIENLLGVDDYDATQLHTVGLRGAGVIGGFDYNAEVSYQFGEAAQQGFLFKPAVYGDDDADFDTFGGTVEVGYSFDYTCKPRLFAGVIYLDGEDNRDISFLEWLNPFDSPKASVSFNRLFSNQIYSGFFDLTNDLSNAWIGRVGALASPVEKLRVLLMVSYFEAVDEFDAPWTLDVGPWRIPTPFSFWTEENDASLGVETDLFVWYQYSEDLTFELGWAHLFADDGLTDGQYSRFNGLLFTGGTDDEDADYVYAGAVLKF